MTPKQWFSLLCFYIFYLFLGASVFYHEEQRLETERRAVALAERLEINALLQKHLAPANLTLQDDLLAQVSDYCSQPVTHPSTDLYTPPYIWNFYHCFFFSFIVCSTVGYGNISPNNTFGRIFMIFYALIGIPVHAILFAYMGEFWGRSFERLYNRYKKFKMSTNRNWVPLKLNLIGQISLYLIPAMIVFIFFPACLFTYFEGWDYSISVYYAFVTLTTIGFGDYVPTFQPHQERTFGIYFTFYQIFILVWFITGVGYLVMIVGFLIKGLRSKRIKRIEHNLAINFKETQKKIWNGVTKDVGYLRNILNEVYFLKFKPVYKDPDERLHQFEMPKSQSCPNLFMEEDDDDNEEKIIPNIRERALSLCVRPNSRRRSRRSGSVFTLNRHHFAYSDSNLSNIDKEKTFNLQKAAVQPGELLAKVVVALGGFRGNIEDGEFERMRQPSIYSNSTMGIHGFSDSQILASEQNYNSSEWSIAASERSYNPQSNRMRAASSMEIKIPIDEVKASTEWTWSGANTQINEIERMRSRLSRPKQNLYKTSLQTKLRTYDSESAAADDFPRDFPSYDDSVSGGVEENSMATITNKSLLSKLNPFKRKPSSALAKRHSLAPGTEMDPQKYFRNTMNGRASISGFSTNRNYLTQHRPSLFAQPCLEEDQDVLENTTIADLIRAIEQAHVASTENLSAGEGDLSVSGKGRRLGTDHLTPPHHQSLLTLNGRMPYSQTIHGPSSDIMPIKSSRAPKRLNSVVSTSPEVRGGILGDSNPFIRRLSFRLPPPYTSSPSPTPSNDFTSSSAIKPVLKRRFSVRPSNLEQAPGQSHKSSQNMQVTTAAGGASTTTNSPSNPFQRRLSWRPTPSSLVTTSTTTNKKDSKK